MMASVAAFLTPLVGLLQYKSVALFIVVTRVLTLINTPTYHKQTHKVNMRILSSSTGCLVASCFETWTNVSAWTVGLWMIRGAIISIAYSRATVTIPDYIKRLKHRLSDKTVAELKEGRKGTEPTFNRLNLYCVGPLFSFLALFIFELALSLVMKQNLDVAYQLKTVGLFGLFFFLNGQYMIAKANYYDREIITQCMEMYAETVLSLYYLPKSAFFSVLGDTTATKTS